MLFLLIFNSQNVGLMRKFAQLFTGGLFDCVIMFAQLSKDINCEVIHNLSCLNYSLRQTLRPVQTHLSDYLEEGYRCLSIIGVCYRLNQT
jgi:hypothetical protein